MDEASEYPRSQISGCFGAYDQSHPGAIRLRSCDWALQRPPHAEPPSGDRGLVPGQSLRAEGIGTDSRDLESPHKANLSILRARMRDSSMGRQGRSNRTLETSL